MKYFLHIDLQLHDQGFDYGAIASSGNSLAELLQNAKVSVLQDGVFAYAQHASETWMQDLLIKEFEQKYGSGFGGPGFGGANNFAAIATYH